MSKSKIRPVPKDSELYHYLKRYLTVYRWLTNNKPVELCDKCRGYGYVPSKKEENND